MHLANCGAAGGVGDADALARRVGCGNGVAAGNGVATVPYPNASAMVGVLVEAIACAIEISGEMEQLHAFLPK